MSDKDVVVRVDAKPVGDVKKPFQDMADAAKGADEALLKPRNRLKEIGGELRTTEKGLKNFQGGLLGLAASASIVDERLGKATLAIGGLHSATQLFRGAGALTAVAGLAPIAAGIAGVGAAAFLASDKLQNSFGGALWRMSDAGKAATEQLKRLKQAQDDIRIGIDLGVGSLSANERYRAEQGVRRPFEERRRTLEEQRAGMLDRAGALRAFPGSAFDPTHEALARIGQSPIDPNNPGAGLMGRETQLHGLAGMGFNTPSDLRIAMAEAEGVRTRAQGAVKTVEAKQAEQVALEPFQQALRAHSATETAAGTLRQRIKQVEGAKDVAEVPWLRGMYGGYHSGMNLVGWGATAGENFVEAYSRGQVLEMRKQLKVLEARAREQAPAAMEAASQIGGRGMSAAARQDLDRQQAEAADRLRASEEKILEIKHRINLAEVDHLKAIQGSVAEQSKLAAQTVREEEARLRGTKSSLGLMGGRDLMHAQAVSRRIAAGQNLGEKDIQFARGLDVFRPAVEAQGLRQAETSPVIQEILKNVGADQRVQQAKEAQGALAKLDANIKHEIDIRLTADAHETAAALKEQLVPGIEKSLENLSKQLAFAMKSFFAEELQKKLLELRSNAAAAAH